MRFMWKQYLERFPKLPRYVLWTGGSVLALAGLWTLGIFSDPPATSSVPKEKAPEITVPGKIVSTKELWVHRIEGKAEDIHKEVNEMRTQNQALKQQVEMMNSMVEAIAKNQLEAQTAQKDQQIPLDDGSIEFPSQGTLGEGVPVKKETIKILSLLESDMPPLPKDKPKSVEEIIPAGTYAAGILTSGIAASTALNAQGDPQPVMVRLTSPGMLPRGFKTDIKEAVVIAACYGDISSERANCRLNKILLVERNGEILSKKAEGWLIGDDGIPGIRGKVVDKAGEVVRSSFWAGLLGGVASYFKAIAQQPQFVLSGAGAVETQQMPQSSMLKSAGATGASNALEKIADFALKRAEQMQPVIMVNPGRSVDVVFKEEVDLSNSTLRQELAFKGNPERQAHAVQEAANKEIQLGSVDLGDFK